MLPAQVLSSSVWTVIIYSSVMKVPELLRLQEALTFIDNMHKSLVDALKERAETVAFDGLYVSDAGNQVSLYFLYNCKHRIMPVH